MLYNVTKIYVLNNGVLYVDEGEISRDSANYNQIDVITNVSGFDVAIAFELPNGVFSDRISLTQNTGTVTIPDSPTQIQPYEGEEWSSYSMLIPNAVLSAITSTTSQTLGFSLRFSKTLNSGEENEYTQAYTTEIGTLSVQGTIGGEPVALDPAFYQNEIVSDLNNLISLYNSLNALVTDSETGLAQKANKTGDTITGQFDFSTVDLDQLQEPLAAIKLGGNNVTTSGQINDYTFQSGDEEKDAIKYANLADLFNLGAVTPQSGENFLQAYTRELTAKFAAIQTVDELAETLLKRDGTDAMTGNLNMGGNNITNVGTVDGVDVESLESNVSSLTDTVNQLQGAYVLRGSVSNTTEDLNENGTQPLTDYIAANFENRAPETGDVLRDGQGGEWYFDGTNWTFVGQAYIDLGNYYTKNDSDERYYTQTELNPQTGDPEEVDFETEASLDARYYTQKDLDEGSLDDRYYTEVETDNLLADKVDVGVLASSIVIYPTDTASGVSNYVRGVSSIDDADYDTTAVDVTTPTVDGIKVPVGSVIADANLFVGNPGVINVPIVGNVRSSANNVEAEFYFEIYKRDDQGVETLIGQESTKTRVVSNQTYEEFSATALLNNGEFTESDRLVFKFFADKVGSVDGTFDFQYGGGSPVRILLNVPIDVTLQAERLTYDNTDTNLTKTNVQEAITELDGKDDTIQENLDNHINDTTGAHAASAISFNPTNVPLTQTDVQAAIAELFDNTTNKIKSDYIELQFEDVIQGYYDSDTDAFYKEDTFTTEITAFDEKSVFVDLNTSDLYRYDSTATPKYIRIVESPAELGDLSNVVVSGAESGQVLEFNGDNWVPATITIPSIDTLNDIGNVNTSGAQNGSVIKYDTTANEGAGGWVIGTDDAGTTISTLGDVGDVTITAIDNGQFLRRNTANDAWENHTLVKADVGLDNVENYPIATVPDDVDNEVTNKYMTPATTAHAVKTQYSAGVIETNTGTTETKIWTGTQAEYDAINTYDNDTLYFITG